MGHPTRSALTFEVAVGTVVVLAGRLVETLYKDQGNLLAAKIAAARVATLGHLRDEIVTASALFHDGDLDPAEKMVRAYIWSRGNHIEAMHLLARIGMKRDDLDEAESLLREIVVKSPDSRAARFDYATLLLRRQRYPSALAEFAALLRIHPRKPDYLAGHAAAVAGMGGTGARVPKSKVANS